VTTALSTQAIANLDPRRRDGQVAIILAKSPRMTTVALIPRTGIIQKHTHGRLSLTTTVREKPMPVAKYLSYVRSRTAPSYRIHGRSLARPRVLPQQTSSPQPAVMAASTASRLTLRTVAQFAEAAGDIILAVASWVLRQIVVGCLAYAVAMYGIPLRSESGKPKPSAPPDPPAPTPTPHVISVSTQADIADECLSPPNVARPCAAADLATRSEHEPVRSVWRTVMIASASLRSKIREASARRRAIAELQKLDDRILRDIGISRADIGFIRRYGARPE
jgi:uncharacterized protein YjiS (DUF1127 family)